MISCIPIASFFHYIYSFTSARDLVNIIVRLVILDSTSRTGNYLKIIVNPARITL